MHGNDIITSQDDIKPGLALRAAVAAEGAWLDLKERAKSIEMRDERGQVSVEWAGILLLVGVIVAAIFALDIDGTVTKKAKEAIEGIFGGSAPTEGGTGGGEGGKGGGE